MARRPIKKRINDLLEPYSKELRDAFFEAIDDLTSNADVKLIIAALEAGNVEAALSALNIDSAVFSTFDQTVARAYQAAGAQAASSLPALTDAEGKTLVIRFNGRNPIAEQWLLNYSKNVIVEITNDQVSMARNHLVDGLANGRPPTQMALDLVGRLNRATGKREGGVIGLTDYQAGLIRNAAGQLSSGSASEMRAYLGRALRDKRFDASVLKAIQDGKAIPAEQQRRMIDQYKSRMLDYRGKTIARTEAMKALHAAQQESITQAANAAGVAPNSVRRIWRTASDKRVRDSHSAMEGQSVGLDEPFTTGDGVQLMYPGDEGAPAEEVINCRCDVEIRIDYLANIR